MSIIDQIEVGGTTYDIGGASYDVAMTYTKDEMNLSEDGTTKTTLPLVAEYVGTRAAWDLLSAQEKAKYRIVHFVGEKGNSSADAGFTPVGTVISVMGVTAPENYLICNGAVYNIADYPELANYFYQQFGQKNKFGGDGTTTFAVPDLRGEFLRGTGTNSHTNQGNGAAVGVHQNGTTHREEAFNSTTGWWGIYKATSDTAVYPFSINDYDSIVSSATGYVSKANTYTAEVSSASLVTSRPTNTSVLYCIATKNIFINPTLEYSTDEKMVGHWINGDAIYQKTIATTMPSAINELKLVDSGALLGKVVSIKAIMCDDNGFNMELFNGTNTFSAFAKVLAYSNGDTYEPERNKIGIITNAEGWLNKELYVTIQYVKATS